MPPIDPETALDLPALPEGEDDIDIDIEPTSPNNQVLAPQLAPPPVEATPQVAAPPPANAIADKKRACESSATPSDELNCAVSPHEDTVLASTPIAAPGDTPTLANITDEPTTGPRNGAERTGRTGIFFAPQHLADGALDDLPPFEAPATQDSGWHYVTGRPANRMRHFVLTRLTPVLALSTVILWSYTQLANPRTSPGIKELPQNTSSTDGLAVLPPPPADLPTTEDTSDIEQDPDFPGLRLATADVIEILADGTAVPRRMDKILARDRVTILNLWATYCGPCKEELPAFRQLFDQQRFAWRGEVEFIPVQIDDPVDGAAARRGHTEQMPSFRHFLSDRGLPTGIKAALVGHPDAPMPWSLPVTVVVRCDGTVEELFATSFKTIEDLRPVLIAVNTALKRPCRARAPKALETKNGATPGPLLPRTPCGATTCTYEENCVERQPGLKPACIQRVQPGSWGS
jgi:thiol-disulfide isomerase/thioredoxin